MEAKNGVRAFPLAHLGPGRECIVTEMNNKARIWVSTETCTAVWQPFVGNAIVKIVIHPVLRAIHSTAVKLNVVYTMTRKNQPETLCICSMDRLLAFSTGIWHYMKVITTLICILNSNKPHKIWIVSYKEKIQIA